MNARRFVYTLLLPFVGRRSRHKRLHVEDLLARGFSEYAFTQEDRRFATFLSYGVLRHWFLLDAAIRPRISVPLDKLDVRLLVLLKMGLYQLSAMSSVPDYAAVSSTLELAESLGLSKKARGVLNAVLNRYIREEKLGLGAWEQAIPDWWRERLLTQYPEEVVRQIAESHLRLPVMTLRVNTLKTLVPEYLAQLDAVGIAYTVSDTVPECVFLTEPQGDPRTLPGYAEGYFLIQDESSAKVAQALAPRPGEHALEIGSAPGTKTTHLAALMQNQGQITALDNAESRMGRLGDNLIRLGATIVKPVVADGTTWAGEGVLYDRILLDAPCSGTGTTGKHPEILIGLSEAAFQSYTGLQRALLQNAWHLLKPSGVLLYSTCSLDKTENEAIIRDFLAKAPEAYLDSMETILPDARRDGFFLARIVKPSS